MSLFRREIGSGPAVVFCHGLFGQGRNWTQIAKAVSETGYRCILLDMPDHGRSEWTSGFDYVEAADLVAENIAEDGPLSLVGHSMGGKIAMLVALRHPELVERLCVADVSPVDYDDDNSAGSQAHLSPFERYIRELKGLDLGALGERSEADRALTEAIPDAGIRGFLLQNLRRDGDGWQWMLNLDGLAESLDAISGWPDLSQLPHGAPDPYEGPVLWVGGADSNYIRPEFVDTMRALFPRVRQASIKNAGHWVHSEQPETFVALLGNFLR